MKGVILFMSEKILYGQMTDVDENGNKTILHQETSATVVLVDKTGNTQGIDGASAIPDDVDTLQKLTDKMGDMAFKSNVSSSDLEEEYIVVAGGEDADIEPPESEINDSVVSASLTWSSKKIDTLINELMAEISRLSSELEELKNTN